MKSEKIWPVGIVVVMTIFVAWMLGVVTVSLQHRPQLISENYYAEGSNLRELKERRAASEATGWKVEVRPLPVEPAEMSLVELTVTEATGASCDSLIGTVAFYRPSDSELDMTSAPIFPIGAGKYLVKIPRQLERGSWQAITQLTRGKQVMDTRVSFFVER
jgi:nitrogen fixation protein FixH